MLQAKFKSVQQNLKQNVQKSQQYKFATEANKLMYFPEPGIQRPPDQSKHNIYHQANRRNDMNELRIYFKNVVSNPEMETYRIEVVKKIITLTTQGVDTARFYPEMVIASATRNLVEKKLIFFYLSGYSHHNADFARMAINTFSKDAYSANPSIRALAIRHLSNLRFKGREEYVMPILKEGLKDLSPIVRKACLMGVTKLVTEQNRKQSEPVRNQQILNQLYQILRDHDPYVVACAIEAINQIELLGIAMSKKLTNYLVKNIQSFGEVQMAAILNYVQLYDPKQQKEVTEILNALSFKLKSQNSALVLAITKIYLKYGTIIPTLMPQIQAKIKSSLLAFINAELPEIEYVVLRHIYYIIRKYETDVYLPEVKKFYPKQNDPLYNKIIKIQLMELNCRKENFGDIVNEFTEYIRDPLIIDTVIEAFNALIIRMGVSQAKIIIKTLNDIVVNVSSKDYICNAAIKTVRTFLRKYPEQFRMFEHTFYIYARGVQDTAARCAMIEIIGDFGELIEDAVELIVWSESAIDDEMKIALLRANVKLFFKRPLEMLNIITNLFKEVLTNDETRMPVKDYAAMLYRGLQGDIEGFKTVFLSGRHFSETVQLPYMSLQFNTLQLAYLRNNSEWLIEKDKYIQLLDQIDYQDQPKDPNGQNQQQLPENRIIKNRSMVDISSTYTTIEPEDIEKDYEMPAEQFEIYWEQYQIGSSITRMVKQIDQLNEQVFEELFRLWGVSLIASIENQESIKQYLYFKLAGRGDKLCMELTIEKQVETLGLVVKTENEQLAGFGSKYVEDLLKINQIL